jgi:hypothetical protein
MRSMAWFVTPRVRFLHVPKTGGSWATDAMCAAGVAATHPEPSPIHAALDDCLDYGDRFTFAFVRHPLGYWRSYWAYRVRTGWDPASPLDREAGSQNFDEFIEGVIALAPGAASALFERFVGPAENEIGFVGRYEHLVEDVCLALRIGGESFDEQVLRAYPKVNTSDYGARGGLYPSSLAARLAEVERSGIERFYSWEPIPARMLINGPAPQVRQPGRQLSDLSLQLRNARAELDQTRSSLARSERVRDQLQCRLDLVENSHLQRWTQPVRHLWYRCRGDARSRRHPEWRQVTRGRLAGRLSWQSVKSVIALIW